MSELQRERRIATCNAVSAACFASALVVVSVDGNGALSAVLAVIGAIASGAALYTEMGGRRP